MKKIFFCIILVVSFSFSASAKEANELYLARIIDGLVEHDRLIEMCKSFSIDYKKSTGKTISIEQGGYIVGAAIALRYEHESTK